MADLSEKNPMKEFSYALVGVALFLGIVLLIGITAFLRPAGEHISPAPAAEVAEETAPAQSTAAEGDEVAGVTEAVTTEEETEANTEIAADANAQATAEPAVDNTGAIATAQSGTATAEGTVSQAAVADAPVNAEVMDADTDGSTEAEATAAQ